MTTARNTFYEYGFKYSRKEAQINFYSNNGPNNADTKFTRFGARDYDPTIGRWTTKDPIGFNSGDTNLYAYVGGNPMSYVDPDGKNAVLPAVVISAIVLYFFDKGIDALPCKDPQACLKEETLKKLKEVEKNQVPKPGQCEPPKPSRPNTPRERKRV